MPPWIEELGKLADPAGLDAWFAGRPELHRRQAVEQLVEEVIRLARLERPRAEAMSDAATRLAEIVGDDYARALSLKARGHLRYLVGDYTAALGLYRECQQGFLPRLGLLTGDEKLVALELPALPDNGCA